MTEHAKAKKFIG